VGKIARDPLITPRDLKTRKSWQKSSKRGSKKTPVYRALIGERKDSL